MATWLGERQHDGVRPHEMSIFVRTAEELPRALQAASAAGLATSLLRDHVKLPEGAIAVGTMHEAKGLEFRAVAVMACDEDVVPLASRIESLSDEGDIEVVYETERHLLYVACTRARDHLLVTGVEPGSEFLEDFTD